MSWDYTKEEENRQAATDPKWKLERQILYEQGEKIDRRLLERHLHELRIPQERREFLELLLWNKVSLPSGNKQ